MRFRLRTLMIVLTLGPPLVVWNLDGVAACLHDPSARTLEMELRSAQARARYQIFHAKNSKKSVWHRNIIYVQVLHKWRQAPHMLFENLVVSNSVNAPAAAKCVSLASQLSHREMPGK